VIERALSHELDVFVDGELEILAGLGSCAMDPSTRRRASIAVNMRPASVEARIVFLLEAAEAIVVESHIAQHLCGDLVVGIEALKFLLEVDSLEIQSFDARGGFRGDATRPGKSSTLSRRSAI
jgi:hypothetical protein